MSIFVPGCSSGLTRSTSFGCVTRYDATTTVDGSGHGGVVSAAPGFGRFVARVAGGVAFGLDGGAVVKAGSVVMCSCGREAIQIVSATALIAAVTNVVFTQSLITSSR